MYVIAICCCQTIWCPLAAHGLRSTPCWYHGFFMIVGSGDFAAVSAWNIMRTHYVFTVGRHPDMSLMTLTGCIRPLLLPLNIALLISASLSLVLWYRYRIFGEQETSHMKIRNWNDQNPERRLVWPRVLQSTVKYRGMSYDLNIFYNYLIVLTLRISAPLSVTAESSVKLVAFSRFPEGWLRRPGSGVAISLPAWPVLELLKDPQFGCLEIIKKIVIVWNYSWLENLNR